jgi:molybdenum cofactor cytidylyltransferase
MRASRAFRRRPAPAGGRDYQRSTRNPTTHTLRTSLESKIPNLELTTMISSILLAAGFSSRMGSPKPLLDWGGQPLLSYQVAQLREAGCDEVIVVLGHRTDEVFRIVRNAKARFMFNAQYAHGRAGSLRIGAKAVNRDTDAIIIINVDQPRPADFLRTLIASHRPESAATQPSHGGHHGHPTIVAGRLRPELMAATEETLGLGGVLRAHATELGEYEAGELCHLDLNTRGEYDAAVAAMGVVSSQ